MVTLVFDGTDDADHLSKAVATGKLPEHHHKKLVPASESLHVPVATVLLDYSIIYSLWQKNNELIEDMFSAIHLGLSCLQAAKLRNQFKSTRGFLLITNLLTIHYKELFDFSLDTIVIKC